MTRREAREQAFMLVFEWEFQKAPLDEMVENASFTEEMKISGFTRELTTAVLKHMEEIDSFVDRFSTKWKRKRIAKVSLAVLRTALGEMLYLDQVPISVSINEAVELSKKYSTEQDSAYINGVLGAAAKEIEKRQPAVNPAVLATGAEANVPMQEVEAGGEQSDIPKAEKAAGEQ